MQHYELDSLTNVREISFWVSEGGGKNAGAQSGWTGEEEGAG